MNACIGNLTVLLFAFAPFAARGNGAVHAIDQDCVATGCFAGDIPGFPITINAPGSYALTSDIAVTTVGATAIIINASPVDLDLRHHTVSGGGSCSGAPVTSCSSGAGLLGISVANGGNPGTVHIHDGTIRGFTHTPGIPTGMYLSDVGDGTVLERLDVIENGGSSNEAISLQGGTVGTVLVRNAHISRNRYNGIACRSGNNATLLVENTEISANGGHSLQISFCTNASISGSRFYGNGGYAIYGIGATTVAISGDTFTGNNAAGVQYSVTNVIDGGGNACIDHACP